MCLFNGSVTQLTPDSMRRSLAKDLSVQFASGLVVTNSNYLIRISVQEVAFENSPAEKAIELLVLNKDLP